MNEQVVIAYRQSYAHFKGNKEVFFSLDNPSIYPLIQILKGSLEAYSQANLTHQPTKRLLKEIQFHTENQDINPFWLLGIHLRFAASTSAITEDEKNVFSHIPYPNLFFGILENNVWHNNFSTYVSYSTYDNNGLALSNSYTSTYLPYSVIDKIEKRIEALLPVYVLYPCVGVGKFSLSFLVKSYLQDIFPIGFPYQNYKGHGITLSRYSGAVHDLLHNEVDRRRYKLIAHVIHRGERYVATGGDVNDFIKNYPLVAVKKYYVLMKSLQEIYDSMIAKLLPYYGLREYWKAMVGFFYLIHENPHFPRALYDMNDFDQILETITQPTQLSGVSASIDEIDSWESSFDPLETSPLDGSSQLSDSQIYEWVLMNLNIEAAQRYKYGNYLSSFELPIDRSKISKKMIKRTDRFIDVVFKLRNGDELKYSFPTLYHKWLNAEDNIGLLRMGGTHIVKPALSTLTDPRKTAQTILDDIHWALESHCNYFKKAANFFANYDPQGDGNSLAQRYFKWHFTQEQKLRNKLEKKM